MTSLQRSLGTKECFALVVGTIIGTGIFLKTATMAQLTGSPTAVMLAWAVAGFLSLAGALCYAELGSRYPKSGGEFAFLREGYGNSLAFLYGWTRFWIGSPGSIAAYAVGASTFFASSFALTGSARQILALSLIWSFSLINCASVLVGGRVQDFLTSLKILMIFGLAVAFLSFGSFGHFIESPSLTDNWQGYSAFGAAIIAALWAFDGWNNMPMAAGEIKNPQRSIPRALGFGILTVLGLYLVINFAYFVALPFDQLAQTNSTLFPEALPVATAAAKSLFGPGAILILSLAFTISAVGAMNGSILTSARVPYAMSKEGLFFQFLSHLSPKTRVPIFAILTQALVASALALSGTFDQLTDYVVFSAWIFYALCVGVLLKTHKSRSPKEGAFRVPFYPWIPIAFLLCSTALLLNTLFHSPYESSIGLCIILSGLPVYFYFSKRLAADPQ